MRELGRRSSAWFIALSLTCTACPALRDDNLEIAPAGSANAGSHAEAGDAASQAGGSNAQAGNGTQGGGNTQGGFSSQGGSTVQGGSGVEGGVGAQGGVDAAGGAAQGGSAPVAGTASCGSALEPDPQAPCPAECNDGCVDGTCKIACASFDVCKAATINCPPGFNCQLTCTSRACVSAIVNCPDDFSCDIVCPGNDSCKWLQQNCGSGPCAMECKTQDSACTGSTIHCGSQSCTGQCDLPRRAKPSLVCGDACSCTPC